jgi:hypothetical protein
MTTKKVSTHTPGPWLISVEDREVVIKPQDGIASQVAIICKYDIELNEREANARLIASAPDMLTVLEQVQRWFHDNIHDADLPIVYVNTSSVIRKAKGE